MPRNSTMSNRYADARPYGSGNRRYKIRTKVSGGMKPYRLRLISSGQDGMASPPDQKHTHRADSDGRTQVREARYRGHRRLWRDRHRCVQVTESRRADPYPETNLYLGSRFRIKLLPAAWYCRIVSQCNAPEDVAEHLIRVHECSRHRESFKVAYRHKIPSWCHRHGPWRSGCIWFDQIHIYGRGSGREHPVRFVEVDRCQRPNPSSVHFLSREGTVATTPKPKGIAEVIPSG